MRIRKRRNDGSASPPLEPVAGNGLLDRRALLGQGIVLAGAVTTGASTALTRDFAHMPSGWRRSIGCHRKPCN